MSGKVTGGAGGASSARPSTSATLRKIIMSKSLRSQLYRAARDLGNVQAARKGPSGIARRVVRREAYRSVNRPLGRLLRALGLLKHPVRPI
jgi:hypothetical protein